MNRNIALYPWFKFLQSLTFWQATWFLYFESHLSASEAILLYVIYDISTTVLEVPSGYMSDKLGRKLTLMAAAISGLAAAILFVLGDSFAQFAVANVLVGAASAFNSGTDTSLLFESLRAEEREDEIQTVELKAWRYSFIALAFSALIGGGLALCGEVLPYVATAISAAVLLAVTTQFREPPHTKSSTHREDVLALLGSLTQPTLLWLLCLSLLMYVVGHIPYVFGQPFIREALAHTGLRAQTPLVSGGVTFTMMLISVAVSMVALPLRRALGLPGILLLALGMQIALTGALAASNGLFVIALLFFRMVPDSLSQPFIRARIQPLLQDGMRATYMSVQSLAGRILFAATLSFAAGRTQDDSLLPYADMRVILGAYTAIALIFLLGLAVSHRRAKV